MAKLPKLPVQSMALTEGDAPVASPAVRTGLQVAIAESVLRLVESTTGWGFSAETGFYALAVLTTVVSLAMNKIEGALGIKLLAPR